MAENQNDTNIDELLNDIALEPDNSTNTEDQDDSTDPRNEENDRIQDEFHDDELKIEPDDSLEIEETQESQESINSDIDEDETVDEDLLDDKEYAVQKKQTKLQKILIGVAASLLIIIILGIVAYFLGVFDPEEVEQKQEVKVEEVQPKKPEVDFNDKDINVDRLNQKLNMLTKYEIIEDAKKEEQKALEKEKLHQEAQRKLEEERLAKIRRMQELEEKRLQEERDARKREEELLNKPKEAEKVMEEPKEEVITVTKENKDITVTYENEPMNEAPQEEMKEKEPVVPEVVIEMEEPKMEEPILMPEPEVMIEEEEKKEVLENNFIKFIVISTNKKEIYKKDLDQITSVDSNVKLCRDESNNIEIFVGPYEDNQRDIKIAVFKYAMKNANIEAVDFTEEEFNKRCNY